MKARVANTRRVMAAIVTVPARHQPTVMLSPTAVNAAMVPIAMPLGRHRAATRRVQSMVIVQVVTVQAVNVLAENVLAQIGANAASAVSVPAATARAKRPSL